MAEPAAPNPGQPKPDEGIIPIEPVNTPPPRGRLDEAGLLEDFDEDADFNRDPELERTVAGDPKPAAAVDAGPIDSRPLFVKAGWDDPKIMGIVGAVLTAAALVATWMTAPEGRTPLFVSLLMLLVLYNTVLHTGTGIVAVVLAAVFTERAVGRYPQAAARMFVAVAAFQLLLHLDVFSETKIEEVLMAGAAYVAIVAATFRVKRDPLLILAGFHFALWLVTGVGMQLAQLVASQPAK